MADRYLNTVNNKVYVITREDEDFTSYKLEKGGKEATLGREEFYKRFQVIREPLSLKTSRRFLPDNDGIIRSYVTIWLTKGDTTIAHIDDYEAFKPILDHLNKEFDLARRETISKKVEQ